MSIDDLFNRVQIDVIINGAYFGDEDAIKEALGRHVRIYHQPVHVFYYNNPIKANAVTYFTATCFWYRDEGPALKDIVAYIINDLWRALDTYHPVRIIIGRTNYDYVDTHYYDWIYIREGGLCSITT